MTEIPYLAAVVLIPALRPLNIERTPSLRQAFPGLLATSGSVRLLTAPWVGFSSSELYRPYLPEQDRPCRRRTRSGLPGSCHPLSDHAARTHD